MSDTPLFNVGSPPKPAKPALSTNHRAMARYQEQARAMREAEIHASLNAIGRRAVESWKARA